MNKFSSLKECFIDTLDNEAYINLDKSQMAYFKIKSALKKPIKLLLFYGKPGSGKSVLLSKLAAELEQENLIYIPQPLINEASFFANLYTKLCAKTPALDASLKPSNFDEFLAAIAPADFLRDPMAILLDEAQLYPPNLLETIRLLSDTRCFKFLFTVHKTAAGEQLLAQEHFSTRIWQSIELVESSREEIALYIEKKAGQSLFSPREIKLLTALCRGNLRTLNMLLYSVFEICEFYEAEQPAKLRTQKNLQKIIEMAALSKGLIDA